MKLEDLKVGSSVYLVRFNRAGGMQRVTVRKYYIARETKTRWVLGIEDNGIKREISTQLLKKDLSVYGGSVGSGQYLPELTEDIKKVQEEDVLRVEARELLQDFEHSYKHNIHLDDERMQDVLKVLKEYAKKEETVTCEGCGEEIPLSELSGVVEMNICKSCEEEK